MGEKDIPTRNFWDTRVVYKWYRVAPREGGGEPQEKMKSDGSESFYLLA